MKLTFGLSEGQVLQRLKSGNANASLTGTCNQTGPVIASLFDGKKSLKNWKKKPVGESTGGKFTAKLDGIPAGGPYRLLLEIGRKSLEIANFYVGDVWLLAGQSNMEGIGDMEGAPEPHPLIRAFSMRREWRLAKDPLHVIKESPDSCHYENTQFTRKEAEQWRRSVIKGVGVGLFFAKEMMKRSKVPQGLICTAHGGTFMRHWNPEEKHLGGASCYASMLTSVQATGQPVAGMLWYQGESDANSEDVPLYTDRMKKLVAAVRRDLRLPGLPWITVQIGKVVTPDLNPQFWNSIQEQQAALPSLIRNLETIPAIDLPMDDGIHIGTKGLSRLALRMARVADRLVYGNPKEKGLPQLVSIKQPKLQRKPGTIFTTVDVVFKNVEGSLQSECEPSGFFLTDSQGNLTPYIHRVKLSGNIARLYFGNPPPAGSHVSYGYGHAPHCNIVDDRDYSLPVFTPRKIPTPGGHFLPFVTEWKTTAVIPSEVPLHRLPCPDVAQWSPVVKSYGADGFVNQHESWLGKKGHCYFAARLNLPQALKLKCLMGYDGPFKLWVDGCLLHSDPKGINPALADEYSKPLELTAGKHDLVIAMDVNKGTAYGFFLRFSLPKADGVKLPSYLV